MPEIEAETTEQRTANDRPGLYLCCMRTAERYYDSNARYGIVIGLVIACSNPKCKQPIEYIGGGWKHADAKRNY